MAVWDICDDMLLSRRDEFWYSTAFHAFFKIFPVWWSFYFFDFSADRTMEERKSINFERNMEVVKK